MMKRLYTLPVLALAFLLSACQPASGPDAVNTGGSALHGAWLDNGGTYHVLDADGGLGIPGHSTGVGLGWSCAGNILSLATMPASGGESMTAEYRILSQSPSRLKLSDASGQTITWRKADKDVAVLNGLLSYRERLALPEQVMVSVRLSRKDGSPITRVVMPSSGQGEIPFRAYYLRKDAGKAPQAMLEVDILIAGVPVLGTPEPQNISLKDNPRIMVQRSADVTPETGTTPPSLEETYWRLATLKGQPVQVFSGQPEPHVIIRTENNQAAGSDGCNNFFFEWTKSGEKIRFGRGGSTLRMCPQGMEQAQSMMDALNKAETWSITGRELELKTGDQTLATFQAVSL